MATQAAYKKVIHAMLLMCAIRYCEQLSMLNK